MVEPPPPPPPEAGGGGLSQVVHWAWQGQNAAKGLCHSLRPRECLALLQSAADQIESALHFETEDLLVSITACIVVQ